MKDEDVQFHVFTEEEQAKGLCGGTSVALCGFVRGPGQSDLAAVTIPVELTPCEVCDLLARAFTPSVADLCVCGGPPHLPGCPLAASP